MTSNAVGAPSSLGVRVLDNHGMRRGRGTYVSPEVKAADLRSPLVRELAERVLREAARAGVGTEELIESIRQAARPGSESKPRHEEVE